MSLTLEDLRVVLDTLLVSYFDDELVPLAVSHKIYAEARGL